MPDDALTNDVNKSALMVLEQIARIIRTDADILELLRKMVATAEEEARRHPAVLFERGSMASRLGSGEGDIVGGQTWFDRLFDTILGHIKDEKQLLKDLLGPENIGKIIDKILA